MALSTRIAPLAIDGYRPNRWGWPGGRRLRPIIKGTATGGGPGAALNDSSAESPKRSTLSNVKGDLGRAEGPDLSWSPGHYG